MIDSIAMNKQHVQRRSSTLRSLPLLPPTIGSTGSGPIRLALTSLAHVLRNSLIFLAIGFFFGYCFTVGEVFTGFPPSQQSVPAFNATNMAWWYGVFATCMVIIISAKLPREQFVVIPTAPMVVDIGANPSAATRKLTLVQCMRKLIPPTSPFLIFGAVCAVGGDYGMQWLIPVEWRALKPFLYMAAFWGFFSMVIVDVYARRIYQTETVRGIATVSAKSKASYQTRRCHRYWIPSMRRFLYVYRQNTPVIIFTMISIVYVHGFSRIIGSSGQWGLLAFSSASIALKLALQELAKHMMIVVRRPVSRRVMVALVSTPTILVDTQVRILLLRQANLNISIAGTIFIAVFEIVVRATKSVIVQRQTREPVQNPWGTRRRSTFVHSLPTLNSSITPIQVIPTRKVMPTLNESGRQTSVSETTAQYKARRDAMERRQKLRVLHAGEIYADMYAEYIAIGCSFIMLFFFRNHPQYEFTILQSDPSSSSNASFREHQLVNLGYLQTSVEVVVDLLACTIEATRGVDFNSFNQNDPFLIFFLSMLTFSNIAISAGLYMH